MILTQRSTDGLNADRHAVGIFEIRTVE